MKPNTGGLNNNKNLFSEELRMYKAGDPTRVQRGDEKKQKGINKEAEDITL